MPITFSSACSPAAPCIYQVDATKVPTGALSTGIGLVGAGTDGATISSPNSTAIGGAAIVLKIDTDANIATP